MSLNPRQIAEAFSNGQFSLAYPYLSEVVEWVVPGENRFTGREAVIKNCENTAAYFKSVTTHFVCHHVIAEGNRVAINGTAEFSRDGERLSFVEACDVYVFNEAGLLTSITSYCIVQTGE